MITTFDIVIYILYGTIAILFVVAWFALYKWNSKLHSYLFLGTAATLISNLGYLMQLKARSEEAYFTALKLSYAGRIWIAFALFLFLAELCRVEVPGLVKAGLSLIHAVTYIVIFSIDYHALYYTNVRVVQAGDFLKVKYGHGPWHRIYTLIQIGYVVLGLIFLIRSWLKERNPETKKKLFIVFMAIFTESLFYILHVTRLITVLESFDITTLGYALGTIFLFIAIIRYNLLDTATLARRFVIDELSEGIIAVDTYGEVSYYNKPALNMFPELRNDPDKVVDMIRLHTESREPIVLDERIYTPEKNEIFQHGKLSGTIYSLVDDTSDVLQMEALEEQKKIADRANKAKSSFLANMSHDIRTPINAVLGMDEMILRESGEKQTLSYARDIRRAGETLLSLINDILDFSKIEEGRMEIIPVQYELRPLIKDLVNMIIGRAEDKGLDFDVSLDRDTPQILYGDEIRIRQVLLNLLTNAVKYTESGSVRLDIGFEKKEDDSIILNFTISDTGIGMKEEEMNKLFSPFERMVEERNRSIEGTGLGMSIVRQLLDLMGSELTVESEYGKGSVFSFGIEQSVVRWDPVGDLKVEDNVPEEETGGYHELFHAPDAHILVVDDTEVNLELIRNLLKKTRMEVDTASSGKEALEMTGAQAYDIIFIDHMMPVMDGMETLKAMKEKGSDNGTVYVALTANAISGAREMYLNAGFNDYLSKPVNGIKLERMIKRYLPAEKVLTPDSDAGEEELNEAIFPETEDEAEELPEWLKDVPGIDVKKGLMNCGSADSFLSVLNIFHGTAVQKADELEELYNSGDIENYTIKVHAMKSSARILGAEAISEAAKKLEEAGKSGDRDYIDENTAALLKDFRELDKYLAPLDEGNEDLPEIPEENLKEAYLTLTEIAGSMDYGMMDSWIREMKGYRLPPEEAGHLRKIEESLNALEWEEIAKLAKEGLERR